MKVVHINTHDSGGAAIAAYRLHQGLLEAGVQSNFLVLYNSGAHADIVTFRPRWHQFVFRKLKMRFHAQQSPPPHDERMEIFSNPFTVYDLLSDPLVQGADVIHLHWVANFVDYKDFFHRNNKPVVWTFHDKNPICGGFHYDIDRAFSSSALTQVDENYVRVKLKAMSKGKYTAITPSAWLAGEVTRSPFREIFEDISVIPYGLDHRIFIPIDRSEARQQLGIRHERPMLLVVATNLNTFRKGLDIVLEVMRGPDLSNVEFAVVGEWTAPAGLRPLYDAGRVSDPAKMNLLYNAADALILTSREDNLPNVMIESLMCGTPVLGFDSGGIKESVNTLIMGMLTSDHSANGLIRLIQTFLATKQFDREQIRAAARAKFGMARQVTEVTKLYTKVINSRHGV